MDLLGIEIGPSSLLLSNALCLCRRNKSVLEKASIKLLEIEISNLIHYFPICSGNLIFLLHDIVYCLLTCGLHEYC